MKDVYITTRNKKAKDEVHRTMNFNRGDIVVNLDFNRKRELIGVEVIDAKEVRINGKRV